MKVIVSSGVVIAEAKENDGLLSQLMKILKAVGIEDEERDSLKLYIDFFVGSYYENKSRQFVREYSLSCARKNPQWLKIEMIADLSDWIKRVGYEIWEVKK